MGSPRPHRAIHRIPGVKRAIWSARVRVGWTPWLIVNRPPEPPVCPPGWRIGPPDFVGVGVQKAGTSWWDALIHDHPQVHENEELPKELHYFNRYWEHPFEEADIAGYHKFFPRPQGKLVGEWTPRYMGDFWTMPLLRRAAPDAKILILLRDPLERYASALAHGLGRQLAPHHPLVPAEGMMRGLYFSQLSSVLASFPRDRILVLQYERCLQDTAGELQRTYSFLGIDSAFVPPGLGRRINPTKAKRPEIPEHTERQLVAAYEDEVRQLTRHFPEIDVRLWPRFAQTQSGSSKPKSITRSLR